MAKRKHKKTGRRILAEGKYVRFVDEGSWEYVERKNSTGVVVIVAVTDERKLLLTEQYRKPVDRPVIDLPAGLAGDIAGAESEDHSAAAQRELIEEVGYRGEHFQRLASGPTSPGLTTEVVTFFQATGLSRVGTGGGDDSEEITVHEVPFEEIDQWLRDRSENGIYIDPKVYAGLYLIGER